MFEMPGIMTMAAASLSNASVRLSARRASASWRRSPISAAKPCGIPG